MKTLIQGGFVVGFNGKEHEVIRDGVVVFDKDRILFVGKQTSESVDRRIEAKGCLVSPGFIDTHFHSGSNASDYLLNEPDKPEKDILTCPEGGTGFGVLTLLNFLSSL